LVRLIGDNLKSYTTLGFLGGLAIRYGPTNCYSVPWPIFSKTEDHIHKMDGQRMSIILHLLLLLLWEKS